MLVNPRLSLYTNASLLAVVILLINYAIVAALSQVLMQFCTESTTVETTEPIIAGGALPYDTFLNTTLAKEGTKNSYPITTTTNVSGCHIRSVRHIVAPHPQYMRLNYYPSYGGGTPSAIAESAKYAHSGVVVDVPCWNELIPCSTGATFGGNYQDLRLDNMPCSMLGQYTPWMGPKADRFPWCSSALEQEARERIVEMNNITTLFGETVSYGEICGGRWFVTPSGVDSVSLSPYNLGHGQFTTLTPYTSYWELNITTVTKTCPTFQSAFANAFAFVAQIEIVVTLAVVLVSKKLGCTKSADDVIDLGLAGAAGVVRKSQLFKQGNGEEPNNVRA